MTALPDRIAAAMYGPGVWDVLAEHGVGQVDPGDGGLAVRLASARQAVLSATPGLGSWPPRVDYVLAPTCIDHCGSDPARLAATVAADLLLGAAVAYLVGVPMVSYVGTGEETRIVPGTAAPGGWKAVADVLGGVFDEFAPPGSVQLTTDEPEVWDTISKTVADDYNRIDNRELDGLYHLTDGSGFPAGTPFTYYYDYYRHNVAHYREPVLTRLLRCPVAGILVVENAQQVKAVAIARRLNAGWPTEHLVTLPAPGRTAGQRTTREETGTRLLLTDVAGFLRDPGQAAPEGLVGDVLEYWLGLRRLRLSLGHAGVL